MRRVRFKRSGRVAITIVRWLLVVCLVAVSVSALSNLGLPTRSQVVDRLSDVEQARLSEMLHLRRTLGDAIWPGWGQADIPVIVYNEAYAFLIGYPDPPPGWLKMPQRIARGGAWERVPDDTFAGQPYFRQRLTDPGITPESFTVLVGERWVATLATKEFAQIDFVRDLRAELPPVVRSVFPYRLAWRWLLGESEAYIGALEHEAFHAYQGQVAPARLAGAEVVMRHDPHYPWDDRGLRAAWQQEVNLLADAAQAETDAEAAVLARRFLTQRDQRRAQSGLSPALVDYERQREWLEGLAKYAELAIGRAAATTPGYQPVPAIANDPDFRRYATRERYWALQLDEVRRLSGRSGETRFYYTGAAQAAVLDRLMPGWKTQMLITDMTLEDMLRAALTGPASQGETILGYGTKKSEPSIVRSAYHVCAYALRTTVAAGLFIFRETLPSARGDALGGRPAAGDAAGDRLRGPDQAGSLRGHGRGAWRWHRPGAAGGCRRQAPDCTAVGVSSSRNSASSG